MADKAQNIWRKLIQDEEKLLSGKEIQIDASSRVEESAVRKEEHEEKIVFKQAGRG